jgi:predicted NBD/HSP70 family sugar kinase
MVWDDDNSPLLGDNVRLRVVPGDSGGAAGPGLIRALNERTLLAQLRAHAPVSRAELARLSGLSKPTVSVAVDSLERSGLVRPVGERTGVAGRAALLYEVDPEAGYVLGLDVGRLKLRGALMDLAGTVLARSTTDGAARVADVVALGESLCAEAGVAMSSVTQTVIGSPCDLVKLEDELRDAFGPHLMLESDVDVSTIAEREHGHGREVEDLAFVSVGARLGMGLILGGRLRRGAHGVAGEIAYLPFGPDSESGPVESAASAAGMVRAARRAGMRGPISVRQVFEAADRGDELAAGVVADAAMLVAKAVCAVISVVDPQLVVLGGGIGRAPGFAESVTAALHGMAPAHPEVRVTALGADAVVDGCLASGLERAWRTLTDDLH